MKNMKKTLFVSIITLFMMVQFIGVQSVFANTDHPLGKELDAMIELGVITGFSDGSIQPNGNVTRGQFAAFIDRALDLPDGSATFTDVNSNMSLATSIHAVSQAGLMGGYSDGSFQPYKDITREQLMVTMQNVMTYSEMALTEKRLTFTDVNEFISSKGVRAAFYAVNYDITNGMPNNDGTLRFEPQSNTTRAQAAAFIYRFLEAKENYVPPVVEEPGEPVPPPPLPEPEPVGYQLATVKDGKLEKAGKVYTAYLDAAAAFNASTSYDAMYSGSELVRVKSGIAYGNNFKGSAKEITIIYLDPDFTKQATYIEHGREMRYISSNDKYIKVQVGATIGYVKHSQTEMIPLALVNPDRRDFYQVSIYGTLIHYIVYHNTNSIHSYPMGPAPEWMDEGVKYFSHDGIHFANSRGETLGKNVPYFQYVSARTKTNYTAEELDAYILKVLTQLEKDYPTKYPNASTKSILLNLGEKMKEAEETHRINALFILSLGIHEGDYGMSLTSQMCKNPFGLAKYDSAKELCPPGGDFENVEESVDELVKKWNKTYINPETQNSLIQRNQGAAFGNKTTGFNVNYASDPTWGSKAGYRMYKIDLDMGSKDLHVYKKIGFTKYGAPTPTNVRTSPTAVDNSNILFTYQARNVGVFEGQDPSKGLPLGYPVTIVETVKGSDGYDWYKIISDRIDAEYGYIRSDVVNVIEYP